MADIKTDYLHKVFNVSDFAKVVQKTVRAAKRMREKIPFDFIAFTGVSGSAMAYILSVELGIPLLCVRKETDTTSHYKDFLEGYVKGGRYAFVDDFISSGKTFERVMESVDVRLNAQCVGCILYHAQRPDHDIRQGSKQYHCFTSYDQADDYWDNSNSYQTCLTYTSADGYPINILYSRPKERST